MDKKKIFLILSSLFILLFLAIVIFFIFFGNKDTKDTTSKHSTSVNTSQLKGDTAYASKDTSSEYDKMIEEAKIQETLQKEKEKKEKEKDNSTKDNSTKDNSTKDNSSPTVKNGVTYEKVNQYISKPEDTASKEKVKITSKTKKQSLTEGLKPTYQKYVEKVPKDVQNKVTKETKVLNKNFKDLTVYNLSTDLKEDTYSKARIKNKNGTYGATVITVLNLTGTYKNVKGVKRKYEIHLDTELMDDYLPEISKTVRELGLPMSEKEFSQMYKRFKSYKTTKKDDRIIGDFGVGVIITW